MFRSSPFAGAQPTRYRAVVSLSWRFLAVFLAFSILPGVAEALENVVHYASEGHLAHVDQTSIAPSSNDEHEHEGGNEHGCNTVFHACGCLAAPLALACQT